MTEFVLHGRSSSHFTRVARMFAHELAVPVRLNPVYELLAQASTAFGNNPALKLPTLQLPGDLIFGTENICRRLATLSGIKPHIVWPEAVGSTLCANAQELIWHGMGAQVQLILGTQVTKLPADSVYFSKIRAGFEGSLAWLDTHLDDVLGDLPNKRQLSLLEVTLYCLVEHLRFRVTVPLTPYPRLLNFAARQSERGSAAATPYVMDKRERLTTV